LSIKSWNLEFIVNLNMRLIISLLYVSLSYSANLRLKNENLIPKDDVNALKTGWYKYFSRFVCSTIF
jgi:hypothetical protein